MPKLVDREQRRQEILEVTWRIMASRGADAATMREIAREAGYANGALAPVLHQQGRTVEAAYVYVFDRTNDRIRTAVAGKRGVAALRAFLVEVLPDHRAHATRGAHRPALLEPHGDRRASGAAERRRLPAVAA